MWLEITKPKFKKMKQSEVKELSVEELSEKLGSLQKSLSDLKMTHAISPLENPIQLRFIKKTIARIKTELTNRSLQES